ncbi:unnamed protein product [Prunus armeniaca]|uniref:Uncharacterized protein n=1 Tax=Prunus armeniaca TaxID=36596 RepID=A0A6J5V1A3_PRUAR|nr:unnamed protein product [Prunus armeniaca]
MWGRSRDDVAHSRAVSRTVLPGPYTPDVALGEVGHVSPSIVAALDSKHNKFAHSHDLSFQSKGTTCSILISHASYNIKFECPTFEIIMHTFGPSRPKALVEIICSSG